MKNLTKLLGIIALAVVIGFSMAGCENPAGHDGDKVLTGTVSINPSGTAIVNTELTATYSGSETVSFQWYKDGTAVPGATTAKYTPITAGSYTVRVSAAGYESKTSAAVEVTAAIPSGTAITYTVEQEGGVDGTADTTAINFTFSESVTGLSASNITITDGTGAVTKGALSGSGTSWTLGVTVTAAGKITVKITKTGIEAETKDVTVYRAGQTVPTLTGITLNTDSVKKAYTHNETLDLSGLVVTANYSNNTSVAVTKYTADPADGATLSTTGTITVTVTYEGKTSTFTVTVTPTLTGITAEYTGTSHVYSFTLRDSLKDHLTVKAQYSDSTSATLEAADYTLSGTLSAGTSTITVTYQSKTTTFDVTVTAATLDSIAVAFDQDDETIYTSAPLDNLKQYLTVTATYTFTGSEQTHEETLSAHEYTLSGELTAGTPTITVTYGDETETFTPTVTAVVLTGITAHYDTATIYTSTPLDNLKQYLTVKANYNDGNEKTLSANEYELSGTLTAGTSTITASYTEDGVTKTATFDVTVTAVALVSITANYTGGAVEINSDVDDLKTALTVTAHYNDGSVPTVSEYTLSGTLTAIGQKNITASYTDDGITKTATFTVTVVCTNHNWGSWTPLTSATCTTAGSEDRTCSLCGITETRPTSIDPNAHNYNWIQTTTPTCSAKGIDTGTCTYNNTHKDTREGADINPDAHDWNVTTTATATAAGTETGVCRHNGSHTYTRNNVLVPMVSVQGGTFQLGKALGSASYNTDITPVSNVTVSGFYIGKYEVTQSQWQTVMGTTIQQLQTAASGGSTNYGRGNAYPIYYVNWSDALVFCNKLSIRESLTPAYRINNSTNPDDWGQLGNAPAVTIVEGSTGYRLPTEAQWEYAAKGGNTGETFAYAGSDVVGNVAWYQGNNGSSGSSTYGSKVVGTKAANGLGIYDMSGNVYELCWDWYGNYTSGNKTDPTGASSGYNHVRRGGGWNSQAVYALSVDRNNADTAGRNYWMGFRVLRPAQ